MEYDCSVLFSDPVAVRHSLEILSELASKDPYAVAMALGNFTLWSFSDPCFKICP